MKLKLAIKFIIGSCLSLLTVSFSESVLAETDAAQCVNNLCSVDAYTCNGNFFQCSRFLESIGSEDANLFRRQIDANIGELNFFTIQSNSSSHPSTGMSRECYERFSACMDRCDTLHWSEVPSCIRSCEIIRNSCQSQVPSNQPKFFSFNQNWQYSTIFPNFVNTCG